MSENMNDRTSQGQPDETAGSLLARLLRAHESNASPDEVLTIERQLPERIREQLQSSGVDLTVADLTIGIKTLD